MSDHGEQQEKLNVISPDFDALAALTVSSERVHLPAPNAPIFDNMTWFVETENGIFPRERVIRTASKKNDASISIATTSNTSLSQVSEQPASSVAKKNKYTNVLTRMDKPVGPITFLKKCMDEKLRVKVCIRNATRIRGSCFGFIEAFDKHMNMVLKDVFETWKRPRKSRTKNIESDTGTAANREECEKVYERDESEVLMTNSGSTSLHKYVENGHKGAENANGCYRIPRWIVKRRTKKKDICERHVDQLLIRGEQVVTVMLEQNSVG